MQMVVTLFEQSGQPPLELPALQIEPELEQMPETFDLWKRPRKRQKM